MNHIKYILPLFFFFCFGKYAVSQPDYNLRFQFVSANGSDYVVDIILSYTSAGRLGSSNLVLSFNGSDIASPVLVSHNLSANYSTPTMTSPGANLASLNIELNVDNSGIPIGVFPAETNLARVRFTVLDPNGFSNLQWNAAHPVHIVFLDNNSDILDANNLVPLNSSPLPLELLFFNTNTKDGTIHLAWKSVNETNFSGYEIQRSEDDGRHFTKISWQPSLGGSWEQPYSLKDTDVRAGVNYYYRLRQIDLDGRYVYSHLVSAELPSDAPQLSISPNPNDGRFWVELSDISEEEITACLIDAQGQKVWSALESGGRWKIGSERALPSGVYILQISNRRQLWVEKVVVR